MSGKQTRRQKILHQMTASNQVIMFVQAVHLYTALQSNSQTTEELTPTRRNISVSNIAEGNTEYIPHRTLTHTSEAHQ